MSHLETTLRLSSGSIGFHDQLSKVVHCSTNEKHYMQYSQSSYHLIQAVLLTKEAVLLLLKKMSNVNVVEII